MTPLFKKIELFEGPSNLIRESHCGGRGLLKSAFKDFQIGKNFRFLDVIWRTVGDGLIQLIINAPVIAHLRLHLFSDRHALVIDILQHTDRIIRCESRFARHNISLQAGFLLVDTVFNKRTFLTVNDKFRIIDFHQMAGFDDGFQVAIKQLRFKGVVRIGFITQAADVISDVIRATEQRNNLVHRMHTKAIKRAILRQPGLVSATGR